MKKKLIKKIAIANRGEVAVRIIHACQELEIETVLLHSDVDINTYAYRLADYKICIGSAPSAESYLNIEAVLNGAIASGADALHPGFGFLSENSEFAKRVTDSGIIFIGPSADSMDLLGNKINSKKWAQKKQIPLIPGYEGQNQEVEFLTKKVIEIGFPVIVKAAQGGGGRGMKLILNEQEAKAQIESAQRESKAAFGSEQIFLEKYLDNAKHIEFQIFVDSTGEVVHLFDRECSVQRRHQKIIEEAVSPSLSPELRSKMAQSAVELVKGSGYQGAATVEFLLDGQEYYLLEVNTRLQVEHPVTEMVLGFDLVKAQILTAQGDFVISQSELGLPKGHSIECRIYAENPFLGGMPSTGKILYQQWPLGPGRRFEYAYEKDDSVTEYYDPMIAKVIVWDTNRRGAIKKMKRVLKDSIIFGVYTNIPFLIEILEHPDFVEGIMTTQFISKYFSDPIEPPTFSEEETQWITDTSKKLQNFQISGGGGDQLSANSSKTIFEFDPFCKMWRGV